MKKLYAIAFLSLCLAVSGQQLRPVAARIKMLKSQKAFPAFALFRRGDTSDGKYPKSLSQYTNLELDKPALQAIYAQKPAVLTVSVAFGQQTLSVDLYRVDNAVPDFKVNSASGATYDYKKGVYYRGVLCSDVASIAAFSFFETQAIGVISSETYGDINVGRLRQSGEATHYIAYSERDLLQDVSLKCGTPDVKTDHGQKGNSSRSQASASQTDKKVRMYYEMDYACYAEHASNMAETLDWMTAVHNNVAAVYANDGISNLVLSEVFVWDEPGQPYNYGIICCGQLYSFARKRWAFNGDLAAYIRGGVGANGYAMGLTFACNAFHGGPTYAGSGPYMEAGSELYFDDFPIFSAMIKVIAHEAGHLLGSAHTHACAWNGNNTQIDDCGNANPFNGGPPEGASCFDPANPIIPENYNGTIMSYCCCSSMAIGFGPQPRQRIIDNIENAPCLGTDGQDSCAPGIAGLHVTDVGANSARIVIDDVSGASQWQFRMLPGDWTTINTNPYTIEGLSPKSVYTFEIKQICDSPFSANYIYSENIYTSGVYCGETIHSYFSDLYQLESSYETSYFPDAPNKKVSVYFDFIRTDDDGDTLYIFNGPSVSDPVLASFTGIHYNIPAIVSTHATGALTFRFVTDDDQWELGWTGHVDCVDAPLGATQFEKLQLRFYPNPFSQTVHFQSGFAVKSISVSDVLGRALFTSTYDALSGELDLRPYASGNYFATVDFGTSRQVYKLVRK